VLQPCDLGDDSLNLHDLLALDAPRYSHDTTVPTEWQTLLVLMLMARRCHFPPRIVWVPWFKRHGHPLVPGSRVLTRSKGIGFRPIWLRKAHDPIQCGSVQSGWRSPSLCFLTATRLPHFCRSSYGSLIVAGRPPIAKNREYRPVAAYNSPGKQQPPQENAQATTNSLLGNEKGSGRPSYRAELEPLSCESGAAERLVR
jgi:hypothetical protein